MTDFSARQPKGIPVGGQFASTIHQESDLSLAATKSGLVIDPSAAGPEAYGLADAGLTGTITAWDGNDGDVPEGSLLYRTSDGQREMALSGLSTDQFTVRYAPNDVDSSFSLQSPADDNPESQVKTIRECLWQATVKDACADRFGCGESYELLDADVVATDNDVSTHLVFRDEDGEWLSMKCNHTQGQITVGSEDAPASQDQVLASSDVGMDIVRETMQEPEDGDYQAATQRAFDEILRTAGADENAPENIRAAAAALPVRNS